MKNFVEIPYEKLLMIQVVLTDQSKRALLNTFPPMHEKVFAHHITIAFKPSFEQAKSLAADCGKEYSFSVLGEGSDDKCQAVLVKGIETNNKIPHITISCTNDTKPVYSNELLSNTSSYELVKYDINLKGILTFVTKSQQSYQQAVEII